MNQKDCEKLQGRWEQGECHATKEMVRHIIASAGFKLNDYAQSYINALEDSERIGGEHGIRVQALYIANNLDGVNDEQLLAMQQLNQIGHEEDVTFALKKSPPDQITETELGRIGEAFENWSITQRKEELFNLELYQEFAKERNIPLDKVLISNPWIEETLTPEALKAVKDAEKRIKIMWGE
jgi:hypothetical protein